MIGFFNQTKLSKTLIFLSLISISINYTSSQDQNESKTEPISLNNETETDDNEIGIPIFIHASSNFDPIRKLRHDETRTELLVKRSQLMTKINAQRMKSNKRIVPPLLTMLYPMRDKDLAKICEKNPTRMACRYHDQLPFKTLNYINQRN